MRPENGAGPGSGQEQRRGRTVAIVESVLIAASLPMLWLWFLRERGYEAFQGWWVNVALGATLVTMLVIAVRRISRWASVGWEESRGVGNGRDK